MITTNKNITKTKKTKLKLKKIKTKDFDKSRKNKRNKTKDFDKSRKNKRNKTKKNQKLGFTETLKKNNIPQKQISPINKEICQTILINGSKINSKYFYPSEFPKLTKIKNIKNIKIK
jgi:hypothetical protein